MTAQRSELNADIGDFSRLIDFARADPVAAAKNGRPIVVVMEKERLKALDSPERTAKRLRNFRGLMRRVSRTLGQMPPLKAQFLGS